METSNSVLFFDKCRLCLLEVGSANIICQDLAQDIMTFTGVMVEKSDNLPQKICTKCLEVIEKAKDLREVAMNNDKLLCSLFGVKEDEIKLDCKDKEDTEKLTKHETPQSERTSDGCHKIKRSSSTSSNQSVNKHEKKKKISVRKDLCETPKSKDVFQSSSTEVEEKKDDKPPRHKMIKKSDGKEEYICGVCNKQFSTWKKLYLHNRLHNKKIICPLDACGKKFATKGDLEKHLRTHTGVKPYICDICDKGFSQHGTLKVHKETVHYCFTFS